MAALLPAPPPAAAAPSLQQLAIKDFRCDACDCNGSWYHALMVDHKFRVTECATQPSGSARITQLTHVRVHFVGWSSKFDEWCATLLVVCLLLL